MAGSQIENGDILTSPGVVRKLMTVCNNLFPASNLIRVEQ
jgi:hypothetical protein